MNQPVPKKIWLFWYQGVAVAPPIVATCIKSWQRKNPNFEVIVLDKFNVTSFIEIPADINIKRTDISFQEFANYIRLKLLKKYGGIWVDASIYCFKDLDAWLFKNKLLTENIFLFRNTNKDRLIGNWFIASTPNHPLIDAWLCAHESYFKNNKFENINTKMGIRWTKFLNFFLTKNIKSTVIWLSFIPRKILKIYPYFIHHYLFNKLYHTNKKFKEQWDKVPKVYNCNLSPICLKKNNKGFKEFLMDYSKEKIPLLKLSHKVNLESSFYLPFMTFIKKDSNNFS